jgi:hypothetical protein
VKRKNRNRTILAICGLLILLIPSIGCAVDDSAGGTMTALSASNTRILALETWKPQIEASVNSLKPLIDNKADKSAVAAPSTPANTYTKAEVDAMLAKFKVDNVDPVSTKLNQWTTGNLPNPSQQPQQNVITPGTPAGQVSYVIQNPPALNMWSLGTAQNISIRIFNNKSDARYVRLQVTANAYQQSIANTITVKTASVLSNSQGQIPAVFTITSIPTDASAMQILYYASSGGVSNGQYLLTAGSYMDILLQLQVTTTAGSNIWTITVNGSDVSVITGY